MNDEERDPYGMYKGGFAAPTATGDRHHHGTKSYVNDLPL